jgi:TRAP-type uncharacterized transport system substrate-binding protein
MASAKLYLLGALGILAVLALAVRALDLAPPDRLTIAAGAPGSAYHAIATRYRSALAEDGVALEIVESAGSVENARRIADPDSPVDLALVQGGIPLSPEDGVEALATVFLEPLFVFHAGALEDVTFPPTWQDLRIAVGAQGSGTRFAFGRMAELMSLNLQINELVPLGGMEAARALLDGEVDVAVFVAPPSAPYLAPLFASEGVRMTEILHAEALARQMPYVERISVPDHGIDYRRERPPREVSLLALSARLVARETLHPAAVNRLIGAAETVHGGPTVLAPEGRFPSALGASLPVDSYARNLIEEGQSPLAEYLPYWAAAQISAIAVLIVPLLFLLLPAMRALPALYEWRMRARIYRHYDELRAIEGAAARATDADDLDRLEHRLDALDRMLFRARLTPAFRGEGYAARMHLDLVRRRLAERRGALAEVSDRGSG